MAEKPEQPLAHSRRRIPHASHFNDWEHSFASLTGVFRETPQGGGGFIFASLKLNQEKIRTLETGFHRF